MLTEECHLNPHLLKNGVEVIDSDLGERIIQLRDEAPSHVVLPAIHLKKEDVGETFWEHLGTEKGLTDPQQLTEAARQHLREKFLAAEVAISGVNFAVAETGSLVVCTNEGNADLAIGLARVHIACMGMEKLIPRLTDLAVFTRLLTRSATGQPITTYTSHFTRPLPGRELHIVIVDNGRSQQLGRPDFRASLKCIRCGACMNTCPVYRRSGGHSYDFTIPGPIGAILSPNIDMKQHASLPFASTLCGSCTDMCPVKIDIHTQLYKWRQVLAAEGHIPASKKYSMKLLSRVLAPAVPVQSRRLVCAPRAALRAPPPHPRPGLQPLGHCPRAASPAQAKLPRMVRPATQPGMMSTSRDKMLAAVRASQPDFLPLPTVPHYGGDATVEKFSAMLTGIGGRVVMLDGLGQLAEVISQLYPAEYHLASTLLPASVDVVGETVVNHLAPIDLAVLRGEIGVAENGTVWLPEANMLHRALPTITQHLVLVLDQRHIVATMHQAYAQITDVGGYGIFLAGPSKTADIEQSLVIGAHGARSLTVLLH